MTHPLLRLEDRLAELDRKIDEAPGWGAYVAALVEERDGIARQLGVEPRRRVGGVPTPD